MTPHLLRLDGFGVAFGARIVLASLDLTFPRRGITVLVGPSGSGKSTLLRTLAGLNDAQPALRTWGSAVYWGRGSGDERPALVMQHAKFLTASVRENLVASLPDRARLERRAQDQVVSELLARCKLNELENWLDQDAVSLSAGLQRRLAIARALAARPSMVMVDEPTAGLDQAEAALVIELLRSQSERCSVVLVTHNQGHALAAGGTTALLAGGRVLAHCSTERFFGHPDSLHAHHFVVSGGCPVPSPMAEPEELAEGVFRPPPLPSAARETSRRIGPRGFYWLKPGRLGGLPRPGIVSSLEEDLTSLQTLGVSVLVTLEESTTIDPQLLLARGLLPHHLPTADMSAPSVEDALALCRRIASWLAGGEVVAVHCKAGLGRTGTTLACQLIFEGETPVRAIERARQINPAWIQSPEQVVLLMKFWSALHQDEAHRASARGS